VKTERFHWIDFIKAAAILAVIVDHSFGILYSNRLIQGYAYYSVTLFILVSGITSAISIERRLKVNARYILDRLLPILILYILGTLVYHYTKHRSIVLTDLMHQLITFSASGPFYFILFYIQLVVISPLLYKIFSRVGSITRVFWLLVIFGIATLLNSYVLFQGIYGGGKYFLGGMYLFIFSFGVFVYFYLSRLTKIVPLILIFILSVLCLFFFAQTRLILNAFSNPPNGFLILYSLIIFWLLFSVWNLLIRPVPVFFKLLRPFASIGKLSLYIFVFHYLFLSIANQIAHTVPMLQNRWILRVWIIAFALIPPMCIGFILNPFFDKKKAIRPMIAIQNLKRFTEDLMQKWRAFFSAHPEFKFILIVLSVAYILRSVLAVQGGQLFWPDETRFSYGYNSIISLLKGDTQSFFTVYVNAPAHSGFYLLSGIMGVIQKIISRITNHDFQQMYWVSALLFSIFSAGNILLVYLIALKAGAERGEALIAGVCMALSNSMFYYTRHLLPYDSSMFFALVALWIGLNEQRYRVYGISGFMIGLSIWVYSGYWIFCVAVVGVLALYKVRSLRECFLRGATMGIGSLLPVYVLLVFGLANGSDTAVSNFVRFLNTAKQGSFREGWTLPWEYFWHSEHGVLLIWLIGLVSALVILVRNPAARQTYFVYWIGAILAIYTIFVFGSSVLEKFVIYGRFARELIPFLSLIVAFSMYTHRNVFLRHRVVSSLGVLFLTTQVFSNFYSPLTQKWPRDFYNNVTKTYGEVYRDVSVLGPSVNNQVTLDSSKKSLIVLNVDLPYPVTGRKQEYSGKRLLKEGHPLSYWPYQYEGWSPTERKFLRISPLFMELIEVYPITSGN